MNPLFTTIVFSDFSLNLGVYLKSFIWKMEVLDTLIWGVWGFESVVQPSYNFLAQVVVKIDRTVEACVKSNSSILIIYIKIKFFCDY